MSSLFAVELYKHNENIIFASCYQEKSLYILDLTDYDKPIVLSIVSYGLAKDAHSLYRDPTKLLFTT